MSQGSDFSWFASVEQLHPREIFALESLFKEDDCDHKINLAFPCYRDEYGMPWTLSEVQIAETVIANDWSITREYLHPFGYEIFNKNAVAMLMGEHSSARIENRAFAIQTLSATGAIRIGAEFLAESLGFKTVYCSQQAEKNIKEVFLSAGFQEYKEIRYFDQYTLSLDVQGMLRDLSRADEESVVVLQVSGHNPTGYDPSPLVWQNIADIVTERKLFPFFISVFQGFVSGDTDQDVEPLRMFEARGLEFICAQSFAWTFGLYNERSGCLAVLVNNVAKVNAIKTHFLHIVSSLYSTPPNHGARIVAYVLGDQMMTDRWKDALKSIAKRLKQMRMYLREELERLDTFGSWVHITDQCGLFCFTGLEITHLLTHNYTGLNDIQVEHLKKQYHIYLMSNGRLNISGLNLENVQFVARAIYETILIIPLSFTLTNM